MNFLRKRLRFPSTPFHYDSIDLVKRSASEWNSSYRTADKSLPILFCLDVSASMLVPGGRGGYAPIDLLNAAISQSLDQLRDTPEAEVEVAFLTFSKKTIDFTGFNPLRNLDSAKFKVIIDPKQSGTKLASAVKESVNMLQQHKMDLVNDRLPHYVPFLIIVTDGAEGDSAKDTASAQKLLEEHCRSRPNQDSLIVPIVIGVGEDGALEKLPGYSKGFLKGNIPFIPFKNLNSIQEFKSLFSQIVDRIHDSVKWNFNQDEEIDIRKTIAEEWDMFGQ